MFAAYTCKVFVQPEEVCSVLCFLTWMSGVKILQGLKARQTSPSCFRTMTSEGFLWLKICDIPQSHRTLNILCVYLCVNMYTQ